MTNITIKEYDSMNYLDSEEITSEYLTACLEDTNPDVFLMALGNIAKVRGMNAARQRHWA